MLKISLLSILCFSCSLALSAQTTQKIYLSGPDKDRTETWEFYCTAGRRSGTWTTIEVPSQWEQEGFGAYAYGRPKEKQTKEEGRYRYRFPAAKDLKGQRVNLVFDGVMTDATVRLNGKRVGPTHHGSFYRFRYDVTDLLKYGKENLLEVDVSKHSSNESVNEAERYADYWVLGGIFRPVWLEVLPATHLRHFTVDARANGNLAIKLDLSEASNANAVAMELRDAGGAVIHQERFTFSAGAPTAELETMVDDIQNWTAETPHLYQLTLHLRAGAQLLHTVTDRIGFRTIAVRPHDGIYLNGKKIRFKGVNRHSWWPETGRTLSRAVHLQDVQLMKEMNMNAVRMSHYPPDEDFLHICDSLGLYVIDELAGWQDAYDSEVGSQLVREMIERDVNRPSVVLWSNGNEGGNNHELLPLYAQYDPQKRTVIHPWAVLNHTDTHHYKDYGCCSGILFGGNEVFFPTEFLHGMYDGGHGAGLDDYWQAMLADPQSAGGFLWDFVDQGLVRTDQDGFIDTYGNMAADGIVGPYREKESSFYSIREIWSPIQIEDTPLRPQTDGKLRVSNQYDFRNLKEFGFTRAMISYGGPADEKASVFMDFPDQLLAPDLEPGLSAYLDLELPEDWETYDAVLLSAFTPEGNKVLDWILPIQQPANITRRALARREGQSEMVVTEALSRITVVCGAYTYAFDPTTGRLLRSSKGDAVLPLHDGPVLATDTTLVATSYTIRPARDSVVLDFSFEGGGFEELAWSVHADGRLALTYAYLPKVGRKRYQNDRYAYLGINFEVPEAGLEKVRYLGDGPHRVYKNRTRGPHFGLHDKPYNDAITGLVWEYPEFKGYFQNLYWARFDYTADLPRMTVFNDTPGLYLRLFTPRNAPDARPGTIVPYPSGTVSFMHAIPPVGTKFKQPAQLGPSGAQNLHMTAGKDTDVTVYRGRLVFTF